MTYTVTSRLQRAMQDAISKATLLTPRQLMFVRMTGDGKTTKQIAYEAGLSIKTVETHRAAVMTRCRLGSFVELLRMAIMLQFAEMEMEIIERTRLSAAHEMAGVA